MNIDAIYDILIVGKIRVFRNPIDKGKPFERMGHKALEPTSRKDLWLSAAKRIKFLKLILR